MVFYGLAYIVVGVEVECLTWHQDSISFLMPIVVQDCKSNFVIIINILKFCSTMKHSSLHANLKVNNIVVTMRAKFTCLRFGTTGSFSNMK